MTPATAFRIGTDGLVAPLRRSHRRCAQPYFRASKGNAAAGDGAGVDVNFRPDRSDEFNFTIQRELSHKLLVEAGYIGRIIRDEYNLVNIDAVPTMTTLNGQSFANAFANLYGEVSAGASDPGSAVLRSGAGRSRFQVLHGLRQLHGGGGRVAKNEHRDHTGLHPVERLERRPFVDSGPHAAGFSGGRPAARYRRSSIPTNWPPATDGATTTPHSSPSPRRIGTA